MLQLDAKVFTLYWMSKRWRLTYSARPTNDLYSAAIVSESNCWFESLAVWQAIRPHWWQAKHTLMQQIALLQAAGALSASQGRVMSVMWTTNSDKLWDNSGTNRTLTVWQTMEPLSDKLTSRCVTSSPSALVTSNTYSYARQTVTNYGMTEAQTELSPCDKLCSHYGTN